MCEFVGFCNLKKDLSKDIHIIKNMNKKLRKQNQFEERYFYDKNINLGYINLSIKNETQLINIKSNNTIYTVIFNGEIYNKKDIKSELNKLGYKFKRRFK